MGDGFSSFNSNSPPFSIFGNSVNLFKSIFEPFNELHKLIKELIKYFISNDKIDLFEFFVVRNISYKYLNISFICLFYNFPIQNINA